jgi:ribosomal protein S18 acetylase RimI-like enzyme
LATTQRFIIVTRRTGVVAASIIVRSNSYRDGAQPFDPGRHMRGVARLVAQVFADELDGRGRSALREMEIVGRLSPFLGGMLSLALFSETFTGHVWVENSRVVGNVTLQNIDAAGSRWRISNVAVSPEHRGRGIARTLLRATLQEVAQRGGNWAVLQVRANNEAACKLYHGLGFEKVWRDGVWRLPVPPFHPPAGDALIPLEPLRPGDGEERLALAQAARSSLGQWAEPIQVAEHRIGPERRLGEWLGGLTGLYRVQRWGMRRDGRLLGAVETYANPVAGFDTLRFAVHPEARGQLEQALVGQGLSALARPDAQEVVVAHDGDHAEGVAALEAAGFRQHRDLVTMRRAVTPADAHR